jgi:hypothetical protein
MQYPEWKKKYEEMCAYIPGGSIIIKKETYDANENRYFMRERYYDNIDLVESVASMTDPILGTYILKAVTEGYTYNYFKMNSNIPCCKDTFYKMYRKFFWILSKRKN